MQAGYFSAAWGDIKNSPGWFGRLFVLSLVGFIPVLGSIVLSGYAFGWARDIAWNVRTPLPARVFGNEDGKLYSRGFFAVVIGFVYALVPMLFGWAWVIASGTGLALFGHGGSGVVISWGVASVLFWVLIKALYLCTAVLYGVGSMRMSVYGSLSSGFQLAKIGAMIRHDFGGLVRIFCMGVLLTIIIGMVVVVAAFVIGVMVAMAILLLGFSAVYTDNPVVLLVIGAVIVVSYVVCALVAMMVMVFIFTMMTRALGYWTRQFDVAAWGAPDDPMPFERAASSAAGLAAPHAVGEPGAQQTPPPPPPQ